jgi:signal transduction histidine kinase
MSRLLVIGALGVFVVGSIILMATAPNLYLLADRSMRAERAAVADLCAAEIRAAGEGNPHLLLLLDTLRRRYALPAVEVSGGVLSGTLSASNLPSETRQVGTRTVTVYFTRSPLPQIGRTLKLTAVFGSLATLAGVFVLIAYLLSLARSGGDPIASGASGLGPSGEMFETSIRALRGRADELKQLHIREKERADELAQVTATLVRSLTSGFIAIDERGMLLDMNQTARDLLAFPEDASREDRAIRDALGDTEFARTLQEAIDSRKALQRHEVIEETVNGDRTIGLSTVPLFDQQGKYLGAIALFADLTPVRILETRVREMQSLADLGEMSAGIAHEFRNSLSTILGYLKLAQKEPLTAGAVERLRNAEQEARLLTAAVESLLSFARPVSLEIQPLELTSLIRGITERLLPLRGDIQTEFRGSPVTIKGDPALLRRAFENVIRNAIDAIDEAGRRGRIVVESTDAPLPRITITDNGAGLNEEDAPRLFLPFQSRKANGFGLGLALVKKIVLLHGGRIRLTGRPGAGATVTIEFDVAASESLSDLPAAAQ